MGGEKNNAEIVENAEKLLKSSVPSKPKKVDVEEPSNEGNPIVPYPQILRGNRLNNQFGKFMEIFKKLHINIPFPKHFNKCRDT